MPKLRVTAAHQTLDEREWSLHLKACQKPKKHNYLLASHKSLQPEMLAYLDKGVAGGTAEAADELSEHDLVDLFLQEGLFAQFCVIQGHSSLQKGSRRKTMDQKEWFALLSHIGLLPHVARYSSTCKQLTKAQAAQCFALAANGSREIDAQQYLTAVDLAVSILAPSALARRTSARASSGSGSIASMKSAKGEGGRGGGGGGGDNGAAITKLVGIGPSGAGGEGEGGEGGGGEGGGGNGGDGWACADDTTWAGFDFTGGELPRSLYTPLSSDFRVLAGSGRGPVAGSKSKPGLGERDGAGREGGGNGGMVERDARAKTPLVVYDAFVKAEVSTLLVVEFDGKMLCGQGCEACCALLQPA